MTAVPQSTDASSEQLPLQGLPASAYTGADWYEREQRKLFARTWTCIGTLDDVPAPGDARPVLVAGRDLLLVRDENGEVHVHNNYCRHRGHPILKEPASGLKRLVCPYHAWAYELDGSLKRAPHFGGVGEHQPDGDSSTVPGLKPVRSAIWHRLVFVNLDENAVPFDDFIAPLNERWSAYDFSTLQRGASRTYHVACNWKLAVENFIDFYHLPAVHKGLNSYSAMQDHYFIRHDGLFFGEGNDHYAPDDAAAGKLPPFPGLAPELMQKTEALCLAPNLLITVFNDNLRAIIVEPMGPGRCRERINVFFVGDAATAPELESVREAAVSRFLEFNNEDIEIIETLQSAFEVNGYDGGCFSPYFDQNIDHFQRLISTALEEPS